MDQIKTKKGSIHGLSMKGYSLFLGIPYAKAPIGPLRWRPPQEVDPWENVYEATRYPNRSMQDEYTNPFYDKEFYDDPQRNTPFSEDSLYLNVWTPASSPDEKLPVAFWIHGGAYLGGYGHEKPFDGKAFCDRGVILVTINYRVGPFGFLAHPLLSEEDRNLGGCGVSGNYGILDQVAALHWVREHISSFGGDPDRITVLGQSAGSKSVQILVSSPLTCGMIAGAIMQSGLGLENESSLSEAEEYGKAFAANAGISTLAEMRALSPEAVLNFARPILRQGMQSGKMVFSPNVDDFLLLSDTASALKGNATHNIPYMVGSTKNDIRVDPECLTQGDPGPVYRACLDWGITMKSIGRSPSYLYYFTRQLPGDSSGAFHSSELWYMFGTLDRCWRPMTAEDYSLSNHMLDYWCNFIKKGDPNGEGLPKWSPLLSKADIKQFDVL